MNRILEMLKEGIPYSTITEETGYCKGTISYYAKKAGLSKGARRQHNYSDIQAYYEEGHTPAECSAYFNFSLDSWYDMARRKKVIPKPKITEVSRDTLNTWLTSNSTKKRHLVKRECLRHGLIRNECYICGQEPVWQGAPLVMVLDHINGVPNDHRIENLRMLCPNCNSQTDTFCGRNTGKAKNNRSKKST